ncbi:hypothetical protein BpHYR1_045169 [Brachionus plicatilis]|uniref:Uncharacterized protein n=1 Tax=Brachionus plicatilis TaxID=10195 RepID=A0A3M7RSK3_BRAPC|nr:hypothetical protein BpHYR1_045169 [Brachionus plicatilis]
MSAMAWVSAAEPERKQNMRSAKGVILSVTRGCSGISCNNNTSVKFGRYNCRRTYTSLVFFFYPVRNGDIRGGDHFRINVCFFSIRVKKKYALDDDAFKFQNKKTFAISKIN